MKSYDVTFTIFLRMDWRGFCLCVKIDALQRHHAVRIGLELIVLLPYRVVSLVQFGDVREAARPGYLDLADRATLAPSSLAATGFCLGLSRRTKLSGALFPSEFRQVEKRVLSVGTDAAEGLVELGGGQIVAEQEASQLLVVVRESHGVKDAGEITVVGQIIDGILPQREAGFQPRPERCTAGGVVCSRRNPGQAGEFRILTGFQLSSELSSEVEMPCSVSDPCKE